jgi:hypothetical protein
VYILLKGENLIFWGEGGGIKFPDPVALSSVQFLRCTYCIGLSTLVDIS